MAVILIEGFDHYEIGGGATTIIQYERKYKSYESSVLSAHSTTTPHSDGYSLELTTNTQRFKPVFGYYYRREDANFSVTEGIVGFHFYTTNYNSDTGIALATLGALTSNAQISIRVDGNTGKLKLYRGITTQELGVSTESISNSSWYYIELKYQISNSIDANSTVLRVDGENWITLGAGTDTQAYTNTSVHYIEIQGASSTTRLIDNLYVCDTSGTLNVDFLNQGEGVFVKTVFPNANGSTNNFTASAGSNYQCVDESEPDEDTTYNESSTSTHKDLFGFADIAEDINIGTIHGINTVCYARRSTDKICSLKLLSYVDSTNYTQANKYNVLNQTYDYFQYIWQTNPDTSQLWTKSEVDASEFGYTFDTDIYGGTEAV